MLFDHLPKEGVEKSVSLAGVDGRAEDRCGDFVADDIGSGCDLILAISVMLFAKGRMGPLLKKCYDTLNPGGVLLVVSEEIKPDHTGPWDMVLGYLPYTHGRAEKRGRRRSPCGRFYRV